MLLHYFVKLENHNFCRIQWHIAYETSEFILLNMRPRNSSVLNPMTVKYGKQCSSAEKWIRDVSELKKSTATLAAADSHWWSSHQWMA